MGNHQHTQNVLKSLKRGDAALAKIFWHLLLKRLPGLSYLMDQLLKNGLAWCRIAWPFMSDVAKRLNECERGQGECLLVGVRYPVFFGEFHLAVLSGRTNLLQCEA